MRLAQRFADSWCRRSARTDNADHGFSVVEVIVVVVIMGVVMTPLAFGVSQTLTYIPRARDVSSSAVQRTTLNDRFGDDVAQATLIDAPSGTSPATTNIPCKSSASGTPVELARMRWDWAETGQYRRITYEVKFGSTVTNGLVQTTIVRLVEFVNGATVTTDTTDDLLSGYCYAATDTGDPPAENAASATWTEVGDEGIARQRLLVTLRLRDSSQDVRTTEYRMLAVMRKV